MDFIETLNKSYGINLNDQQKQAVMDIEGPMLLLSVPGGGKTTVIISRCANMVLNHDVAPQEILTLTFSKASAEDMKTRFISIFGNDVKAGMNFSTIHAFCYRLMRYFCSVTGDVFPAIIEDAAHAMNKNRLLRDIYLEVNKEYVTEDKLDELTSALSYSKNMMLERADIGNSCPGIRNFDEIYEIYEQYKAEHSLIDFDDLLIKTYTLLHDNEKFRRAALDKFKYVNIDESQDNSFLQHELIRLIALASNNLFMVGDEDQSIYGFRGAFPHALLDFKKTYPTGHVLLMERNYRSTEAIIDCARDFIRRNKHRYAKNMFTKRERGESVGIRVFEEKEDQFEYIIECFKKPESAGTSKAVLFRNNISAIALMDCLEQSSIPFILKDKKLSFFKHWIITDILSFIRLSENPNDIEAFSKIYYKLHAFLSKSVVQFVTAKSAADGNIFDRVLSFPGLNAASYEKLESIRETIRSLKDLHPAEMIDMIENKLGYRQYLAESLNGNVNSQDAHRQVLNALKSIALGCKSSSDLQKRVGVLKNAAGKKSDRQMGSDFITLSTVHASKGLEFDHVFVIDMHDGLFPTYGSINSSEKDASAMEEEARLFYVALTRARERLDILSSRNISGQRARVSRFMIDLLPACEKREYSRPSELLAAGTSAYEISKKIKARKKPGKIIEIYLDKHVVHETFGSGYIRLLDLDKDAIEIHFHKYGTKHLSIKACFELGLLSDADTV